ncbi:MAG: hypothetical protein FJ284_05415 [Planctomycetes bacterium]|nr:hypothetical protein [Planctomycetota bacterium]
MREDEHPPGSLGSVGISKAVPLKPYATEFRGAVLAACDRGRSTREVATCFNVSESWVRRVKQERRELNKGAPWLTRRRTPLWARRTAAIATRRRDAR